MAQITFNHLSFTYPEAKQFALRDISLDIEAGEFVVICGDSGCGKSTLLRQLKREIAPHGQQTGELLYEGTSLSQLDSRRAAQEIGFVMQNPENQIVTDKVWHELAFGLENLGLKTDQIRRRVAEMASFFGIQDWFHKKTSQLSGGQKQLLNLAAVMVMQPKVLILDEPTSQLDPIAATEFIETLKKINRELALTILLVEHRLEEVFPLADRVAVMDMGKVICFDRPEAVGQRLREIAPDHNMLLGLPTAVRVYNRLDAPGPCPLTVRDGRLFLSNNYTNDISFLPKSEPLLAQNETVMQLQDVWFRYDRDLPDVLKGVNLDVKKGELLSVLGGNGVGKTTMLGVLSGLYKAYRGQVFIQGKKISDFKANELYHGLLAVLPQNPQTLFVKNSVYDDLAEITKQMKMNQQEAETRIYEVAQMLGIEHILSMHPYDISGGEQQKAAFSKIMLLNPKIILLDEPTKGIDAHSKQVLAGILKALKRRSVTIVMISHDIEFSAEHSDRCAMFFDGGVVSVSNPVDFFSGNSFYTTAANRMSRHLYQNAITCEDVVTLCQRNGLKNL